MKHALSLSLLTLALAGCATTPSPEKVAGLNEDARKTAGGLIQTLGGELKTALTAGGPGGAIGVCKEKAPQIAAEAMQKTGFQIKRVSPKNRNPKGVPDAWETQAQADLEAAAAEGLAPALVARLKLDGAKLDGAIAGVRQVEWPEIPAFDGSARFAFVAAVVL